MSDIRSVAITVDVGCPFELCGVGVAGADVAGLKLLELLLRAEFVCLFAGEVLLVGFGRWDGSKRGGWGTYHD